MSIRKGEEKDITEVFQLLQDCGKFMSINGLEQWNEYYPTIDLVENDVANQSIFCKVTDNHIAGVITLDGNQSPEYADVNWQIVNKKVAVIHRMAVSPNFQRQGIARELMDFAENKAKEEGYECIRLDAYSYNSSALNIYKNRGYRQVGEVYFPIREHPFYCFEKEL